MKLLMMVNGRTVKVDDEDWLSLSEFTWCEKPRSDGHGSYAYRYAKRENGTGYRRILMHDQIMQPDKSIGIRIDHRDGDGLNNTRINLRESTQRQNAQNMRVLNTERQKRKSSQFKGVSRSLVHKKDSLSKPWRSRIRVNGALITLGFFATEEAAALAYNDAARKYFGDFANLNEVPQ